MKEKIWFIFKLGDKHHQGPFSREEIGLLRQQGKLTENIILWKEGMKRWEPLNECPEFNPTPPPKKETPPPRKNIREALSKLHNQQVSKKSTEKAPKETPSQPIKKEPHQPLHPPSKESHFIRLGMGVGIALLVTFIIWPKNILVKDDVFPHSLTPDKRHYLKQVSEIPSSKKPIFRMAINKKRDQLWLASNYEGEGKVFLTLISNPNKTLSLKKIIITSQAHFRHKYAQFTHFSLVKGNWPVPGEYRAKISFYPKNRKKKAITWKGGFILPPKGRQSLSQTLERWKKNIHDHYLSPLKNQYLYYETLKSHLVNMEHFYKKSFQAKTWQGFAVLFEQHYNREVGPLLQKFILDGRQLHLSLFNRDFENSKEYEKLFLYSKKIGALASDMLTQTGQGIIKKSEKQLIGNNLLSRLNQLLNQADSTLKDIQKKIDYYQEELPKH